MDSDKALFQKLEELKEQWKTGALSLDEFAFFCARAGIDWAKETHEEIYQQLIKERK